MQGSTAHQLQTAHKHLQTLSQQSASLHSVLRTISNVMPATPAQHDRWQAGDSQDSAHMPFEPQEVLEQVQSFMQHVEEQHQRQAYGSMQNHASMRGLHAGRGKGGVHRAGQTGGTSSAASIAYVLCELQNVPLQRVSSSYL